MTQWEQTLERLSNACASFAEGSQGVRDALEGKEPKYHTAKPDGWITDPTDPEPLRCIECGKQATRHDVLCAECDRGL